MKGSYYTRDLVLVGGGHAHCIVLRMLAMKPVPGLRITLVSTDSHTPYSGMLPGLIAGHYSFEQSHIDLEALAFWAGARFCRARVQGIDVESKCLYLEGQRSNIYYDVVSLDIGSAPDTEGVEGVSDYAVPVKPISRFYSRWVQLEASVLAAETEKAVAVVGGGAGSVEFILSMKHRFANKPIKFYLLAAAEELLGDYGTAARNRITAELKSQGVEVRTNFRVGKVESNRVYSLQGEELLVDEVFWCTAAAAAAWLKDSGLQCDQRGFVEVANNLQSVSHESVFAAGDVASLIENPRPKAGVYAVRQGPYLAENIRRYFLGEKQKSYKPQRHFLSLIALGDKNATADRAGLSISGSWVWRWKNRIDQKFMEQFQLLPKMPVSVADDSLLEDMHCGGCGGKLPADMLHRVLGGLSAGSTQATGPVGQLGADDAAILELKGDVTLLQSLDVLRELISDPFVMGRIAANHALSDIYAMGGQPVTALALVSLPYSHLRIQERDMRQLMAGAVYEFEAVDCKLAGGHSLESSELSIGFAVTGKSRDSDAVLGKTGVREDDRLILCKPLGTGILYAAQREAIADGRWLAAAQQTMLQSNREAAAIASQYKASACTDVTGFGLLGHLHEMLAGSGLGAELSLESIPLLPGVEQCIERGVASTMYEANRWLENQIDNGEQYRTHPCYPALYDPQTSGGLLFSVSAQQQDACLESLGRAGYTQAAVIGSVRQGHILLRSSRSACF